MKAISEEILSKDHNVYVDIQTYSKLSKLDELLLLPDTGTETEKNVKSSHNYRPRILNSQK